MSIKVKWELGLLPFTVLAFLAGLIPAMVNLSTFWLVHEVGPRTVLGSFLSMLPFYSLFFGLAISLLIGNFTRCRRDNDDRIRFLYVCFMAPATKVLVTFPFAMLSMRSIGLFAPGYLAMTSVILMGGKYILGINLRGMRLVLSLIVMLLSSYLAANWPRVITGVVPNGIDGVVYLQTLSDLVLFIPLALILAFSARHTGEDPEPGNRIPRISGRALKVIAFAPAVILVAAIIIMSLVSYEGFCFGFTDGKWECSFFDYLWRQFQFGLIFLSWPCIFWAMIFALFPLQSEKNTKPAIDTKTGSEA